MSRELEGELDNVASKEKEAKWIVDEMVFALKMRLEDSRAHTPRRVVDLPFLEDELKRWGVRLIIKNESTSVFTLIVIENNTIKVLAKTEEEFLRLIMDMIAEKLGIARTW